MNGEHQNDQQERRIELNRQLANIDASLKILDNGQQEIVRRLDKVNGSISTLYQRTDQNRADLKDHVIDCPQKQKIQSMDAKIDLAHESMSDKMVELQLSIERIIARDKATEDESDTWKEKLLYPIIKYAATALFFLLLLHASHMLKIG